jgi:non-homologous end joining protein Ku
MSLLPSGSRALTQIDIESFVPRAELDDRYIDTPYYLAPSDRVAQEAFASIRDAVRTKGVVGIARVDLGVCRARERSRQAALD